MVTLQDHIVTRGRDEAAVGTDLYGQAFSVRREPAPCAERKFRAAVRRRFELQAALNRRGAEHRPRLK
jgi:hypothetical protein